MAVTLLPDAEKTVSAYLRARSEVTALVGDRVYTAIPNSPTFPLVRLTRVGGTPVHSRPLWVDEALIQVDVFGTVPGETGSGGRRQIHQIAETCRAALVEMADTAHDEAVVDGVSFGPFSWLPDDTYTPARPRFLFDVTVHLHVKPA